MLLIYELASNLLIRKATLVEITVSKYTKSN